MAAGRALPVGARADSRRGHLRGRADARRRHRGDGHRPARLAADPGPPATPGHRLHPYLQPPLATGFVRYVGDPVAAVLADDPYLAEDAADAVRLDLEELPVALDAHAAATGRLASRPDVPAEVGVVEFGYGEVDEVFATAPHAFSVDLTVGGTAAPRWSREDWSRSTTSALTG
ncbi:hypothetical protein ACFQ0G_12455 [Streptomyces chiangmaiensis]